MRGYLHHVEIYVQDLFQSREFWQWFLEELGYKLFQEWDAGFSMKLGPTYLVFVQTKEKYQSLPYHRCQAGLNHLAFHALSESDVDEMTKKVQVKGCKILYPEKHPRASGGYALYFEDPQRIKVEFAFY